MERIPEFVSNHPFMMGALVATILMIVILEYQRATRAGRPLTPAQATRLRNDRDAVVLDVRPRKEYDQGHIPGARSLPEREVAQSIKQLEKHRETPIIICDGGGLQAERAAKTLKNNGFTALYVIDGGLPAWQKAELPLNRDRATR